MAQLKIFAVIIYGLLFQISNGQSVKGGSRSVKGGSQSQYQSRGSSSQVQVEEPVQRQYYSQSNAAPQPTCDRPNPPMNGRLSCQMANQRYTCTGGCNAGYKFPDGTDTMELECSQMTGVWLPYRNFPECVGSYGGSSYQSSHEQSYRREYSRSSSQHGTHESGYGSAQSQSSYGGGPYGHGQSQLRQSLCGSPKSPMNGRHFCSMANGQWTCQGTCNPGYEFPDRSRQLTLTCDDRDGRWAPLPGFPDCGMLCHPECENGGQCTVHNQCLCPSTHRGNRCQYPVSLCDFNRIAPGLLISDCAHNADITDCKIACPPGMRFEPPTTSHYRCTVDGLWNPPTPPDCVTESLCERPPPPMNGHIQCQGSSEIMLCRGTCMAGFMFPEGFSELTIQCVRRTGQWSPDVGFPNCEAVCNPPCQNGGKCIGHNSCLCTKGYRGGRCQYPTSICDGHDRFASVIWSCKNDERETACTVGCGQSAGQLQPAEPTIYICSIDGTWQPDLKPICVTDYSQIERRAGQGERYVFQGENEYSQSSGQDRSSMSRESSRRGGTFGGQQQEDYEFGGQQPIDHDFGGQQRIGHEFGGQQTVDHDFGGQQRIGHEFGGQQTVDHDFGGQQQVDYDFDNGNRRQNLGGYPEPYSKKETAGQQYAQRPIAEEYERGQQYPERRQEEGKEAFDVRVSKGGYESKDIEDNYGQHEDVKQIETEIDDTNGDIFSTIERVSSYRGTCSAWGYHHFRNFDGGSFTFPSTCTYILASRCGHDDLSINLLTQCNPHTPCDRIVGIQIQENMYLLSYDKGLIHDGTKIPIPVHIGGLTVEIITRYIVARLTAGFTIWINEENTVLIVANQFMKNRTCGMCGNFDGYLDPLFISKDGTRTHDIYTFANSWKRDPDGVCIDNVEPGLPCSTDTRQKRLESDASNLLCASIYDAQFLPCAEFVDADIYYAKCQMDCCSLMASEDCECASVGEFILECIRNDADMNINWRTAGLCPMHCGNGTEYNECGPPCPATCDDQEPMCQQEKCVDGCHCPEGSVLEDGRCVSVDLCPCHHGERIYASGETMEQDCNICVCQGGKWQCTDAVCPATCFISGPYILTFDALNYDYSGSCPHYLVESDDFNVQLDYSYNCRNLDSLMSVCIRGITIISPEGAVVKLKQTMEVSVNGRDMISLPVLAPGVYVGQATSKYIKARLYNGLEILWDMDSSIQIFAPVSLFDAVRGLCGTFTRTQHDDYLTPEGDIEQSAKVFAQKWRVEEDCVNLPRLPEAADEKPCDRDPRRRTFAATVCGIIKGDEFKDCHSLIDYSRYYEECMEDVCGCMTEPVSCSCQSLSNYATLCANRGQPLSWRQSIPECGIPCPMGQIYLACANPCTYTCPEIAHSYSTCREVCVEGCVCPPGQTLDVHGKCRPVSTCSCIHSGHVYPPDFMQRRGREMCECAQGQWSCHEASPEDFLLTPPPHVAPECDARKNLEPTDCVSSCPITCANLHHHQPCTTSICVPGCRCKKGYIKDASSGKCVLPIECPCHHSGRSFEEGEEVKMDCHTCICESGMWECDTNPCPGLCSAWGDSHYETFDGRLFDFEGACDYVMVKAHLSPSVVFSVVIQNSPCGGNAGATCGKSLSITLAEQNLILTRDHPLPDIPENSQLSLTSVGMFTLVDSDIGISVQWDRSSRVYVTAQPIWKGKLQGLCGNFDEDSYNDFRSPSGGIPLVLAKDFADSWRVHKFCKPATQPEITCDLNPERRTWSKHKCSVLKSELFNSCHNQVEVEEYFKRCVLDSCACNSGGDCECLCAVVSAYAQKCARAGVVIAWRSQDLCPVQCESCDRYNPCISLCPPVNCDNYLEDSNEGHTCTREPCVDGCEPKPCEPGQVYKSATNLTCIPEHFCSEKPCIVVDGIPYREGERIESEDIGDACQSCYCRRGEVECIGVPCATTTPRPKIGIKLEECQFTGWTDWINSVDPLDNDGNDIEDLEDLSISQRLPCPRANITSIQCRSVETQEPIDNVRQKVICDLETGMACRSDYYNGFCEDYEIRLYCQCHEEVTCPPGQEWKTCAFDCDNLCHSMDTYLDEEGACDRNQKCVPGCVKRVCQPPKLARDAETCVMPDMCTCRLPSGVTLAPGDVVTDGCQKCQCLNNTLICSTILQCKEIITEKPTSALPRLRPISEAYTTPVPELRCLTGWSYWQNLNSPGSYGEREPLEDLEQLALLSCALDQVTRIQCREVDTLKLVKLSGLNGVYCDLSTQGLECKNEDMPSGMRCPDFEIRAYCDCEVISKRPKPPGIALPQYTISEAYTTPVPELRCVTGWSYWQNLNSPGIYGETEAVEDLEKLALLSCALDQVTHIQCREADTLKVVKLSGLNGVYCDLNTQGLECKNENMRNGMRCPDFEIRAYCDCEVKSKRPKPPEIALPQYTVFETYTTPVTELECLTGWSEWLSLQIPDSSGESESLQDWEEAELLNCFMDQVTQLQCREVQTLKVVKLSGLNGIYCDLNTQGLECKNEDMPSGKRCPNFEIRAYCDCEIVSKRKKARVKPALGLPEYTTRRITTTTPTPPFRGTAGLLPGVGIISTTPSCSYWSDWINKGKPRKGKKHGDREDTKPYILKQTEGFCLEGYVSAIECKEATTGKDYTETNEERLVCDINKGFQCQNKHQPDGRCQDYKIRYFCTCGEEETEVPLFIRTTPATYIYPCSELIPLIDGDEPLPDYHIKASSSDSYRSGLDAIKIKSGGRKKAWTPAVSDRKQYIEVNLGDIRAIYGIITKGKEDADEWVTSYQLLYSTDGNSYSYYQDENDNNKVFSGNYDDTMEVKHIFAQPFEAKYVRLEPLTWEERISLQMDLLGCAEAIITTVVPEIPYEVPFFPEEECKEPMGLESESIPGYLLSASSFDDDETSPQNGRMGSNTAWVAAKNDGNQYFQVDFSEDATITGVVTKGRTDRPQWVRSYTVAYTTDMKNWNEIENEDDEIIEFSANRDQDTRVTNEFPQSVKAKAIRIIPVSWKNGIGMQVEILGCPLPEEEEEAGGLPISGRKCKRRMGLENGLLMDSQISASSSYSSKFTPDLSRLRSESVWAAAVVDDDQYLQVDFIEPQRVSGIVTKGREDVPQWVTAYVIEYSKDGTIWNKIKDESGDDKEFPGNYDPFSTVENLFPKTIRTRFLRIRPTKWKNWISMQIEVLGCYHPTPCQDPMGVENEVITDHQLTASSELSETVSADNGRLSSATAWSPEISDKAPYLQVDLLEPMQLTGVITKGSPVVQQWVKSFYVAYSNDTGYWKKVENAKGGAKEFIGNEDQDSAVINLFPIAATGRYFRIIPLEWHRWIALRMELLGCFHERVCLEPMGLENGVLPDAQISASSSFDLDTTPSHARINDKSGWQPGKLDKHPYLQIDLIEFRNVSAVVTKGMENTDNWVTKFKIVFSENSRKWYPIITDDGDDLVFKGNEDRDTPVVNNFPEKVEARFFRIVPLEFENAPGLRLELLGCYHPYECQESLGMESGSILDFQITASSYLSYEYSPINSRLDSDTAWVAKVNDNDQYLQVDLMIPTNITGLMTRGRNDANEWVEEYKIAYSVDAENMFFTEIKEDGETKVFPANLDSESSVTNLFPEPVFARFIRIIPTQFEKRISMRFELIGCHYKTECMEPMGLENGMLDDSHITASSHLSENGTPAKLRLTSGASWLADNVDDPQYVQVNFGDPRNVSAVVTKGDSNDPLWVTEYRVAYSDDEETWSLIEDFKGDPIDFPGNTDKDSSVINVFPETVEAQYIRIMPTKWKRWIALRAEILGCYHPYGEYVPEYVTVIPERVLPFTGVPTEPTMIALCPDPMEAENTVLLDARIKASSSTPNGSPSRLLLHTRADNGQSGGWVPNVDDLHPVLLIELSEPRLLTSIHTQGRADEENWVKTLRVIASTDDNTWMPVFGPDSNEYIEANEDQHTVVSAYFDKPVEAKYIKIIPETWHKWPSFRMDLKGCHIPEEVSSVVVPTIPAYPDLCPELMHHPELAIDCPEDCPEGSVCNGENCIDPVDCSCVHDGQLFKVGDRMEDRACKQCDCALGGNTVCQEKQCEPCEEGKTSIVTDDCSCSCEECDDDERLCPTNGECIPEKRWCDGIVDCPDDETDCVPGKKGMPRPGLRIPTTTSKPRGMVSPGMVAPTTTMAPGMPTEMVGPSTIVPGVIPPGFIIPGKPPGPANDTCDIMGKHINTFDGQDIIYDVCKHVAMKHINGKFNVTIYKECGYFSECQHWIEVYHLDYHIKVQSDLTVEVNGHSYNTAQLWRLSKKTKMTLFAKKVGEQVIIKSLSDGFTVVYDVRGHLEIEVMPELLKKIRGLCGYYSGKPEDDQRKPNELLAFTSKEFGDSWAVGDGDEECKPLICPHEEMKKSMELCHKLKEDPFIQCGKILHLNQFIEFCMSSTCECLMNKKNSENKCKCDSFLPFVEACESKLGPLAVRNWRLLHECHTECPPGMEWNDCGPSCQLTCDSATATTLEECSGKCVPGCFCPPGTVLNDVVCIPPDECADQVCQGFGDPHFRTFDGLFFPFQAVGSFLIVSDKDNEIAVNGLSKKCGLFTPITCLVGLEVTYKQHTVSIKKRKELKVDGKKVPMDKLPLHKDGMVILGYPGRTFVVVIPSISFEARYYEENTGFAVRVPSRKYFNKTEGLCGNCNGRKDDELKKEPLDEYVCSWQTDGSKEECMDSLKELPELTEEIPICKELQDPVFAACHPLIDVGIYVDACTFDATHSGDSKASFCKTAMEYGRQCCDAGIAIPYWPKELGCDIDCPSGMEYEQCHKGCPQTCISLKNDSGDPSCTQMRTDGCFCPEGKVLKDDVCVDTNLCETCDEEGHVSGDTWKDGDCKQCHCREDLTTECVLELCPMKPICSTGEALVKSERETSSCCESYACVPKKEECETMDIPKCKPGEVAKVHTDHDSCPVLKCECDPLLCAPLVWPEDIEEGQKAIVSNESCCPVIQIACFEELCPEKPECDKDLELIETQGECCNAYKCKPPKDVCVYSHMYKVVDGLQSLVEQIEIDTTIYQPGDEWEDGLCEKCSCVESKGQYVPHCIMEHCSALEDMPENKDYVLKEMSIPEKCCPDILKMQCRDDERNIYEPGEQWQDVDNPCITYLCEEYGGEVIKTKSIISCTECPRTAVLFPPSKALGQCCGVCKPDKCEDGDDLYSIGDIWTSPDDVCKMAECVSEFGKIKAIYTRQPCPIIPEDCPPDSIIWDENGCCKICNLTSQISCSTGPIPEEDTIGFFTYHEPSEGGVCVNEKPVLKVLQCKGACHSQSYYSLEDGDFKDNCQCCKVNITISRTIELRCPNGNYIKKNFLQPESCQCSKCAPKSEKPKSKTNFNSQPWVQQNEWGTPNSEFEFAQKPNNLERFTEQRNVEQEPINSWQFQQNQVQQEQEDYDNF